MTEQVSALDLIHPLDCPFVAHVRQECANFTWFYDRGYIRYYDGTPLMLREHQRVAVAAYGVDLSRGWHIHHRDGDRLNNVAHNLAVLSASEHLRLHGSLQRAERTALVCPICEHVFEAKLDEVTNRNKTYCSKGCRSAAERRVERPSASALAQLLGQVNNWTVLGRMFGVSDNAVRKWAKTYGLDLSVCDGRRK